MRLDYYVLLEPEAPTLKSSEYGVRISFRRWRGVSTTRRSLGHLILVCKFSSDPLFSVYVKPLSRKLYKFSNCMSSSLNAGPGSLLLSASCINCFTPGTGTASTQGFQANDTLLNDIVKATEELAQDPQAFIASALDMNILIELKNLSSHFEFDVKFGAGGSISVPIFEPIHSSWW